ncbi:MAG TPA: NAD(P)/FAD-dependent oxidoreductase, partial [Mesotoga prima]|uniref:NAD(P)/FAD-dependent oxidoreductase n=1 Tax=Mesotoga prima TaxID=1184387 RepID=UPI002D17A81B
RRDSMHSKVIVVGAGPAGLAASRIFARDGIDFLLLDSKSFPRDKGCGGGLTPRSLKRVHEIFPEVDIEGFDCHELSINRIIDGQMKHLTTLMSKKTIFKTVDRKEFDNALLKSIVERGGRFLSSRVKEIVKEEQGFVVKTEERELTSDYVIVSAGVFGAKLLGHEPPSFGVAYYGYSSPTGSASVTFIPNGYLWSFPGESFDSVGGGVYPDSEKTPSYEEMSTLIKRSFDEEIDLRGAPIPTFNTDVVLSLNNIYTNLLVAGDSAGLVDNWTGAGIDFALDSGRQAALSIIEDGYKGKTVNERYLERLFPAARHLQIADAFRKRFNRNFEEHLDLLKGRMTGKLLSNYLGYYVKGPYRLAFKSLFTRGISSR